MNKEEIYNYLKENLRINIRDIDFIKKLVLEIRQSPQHRYEILDSVDLEYYDDY